MYDLGSIFRVDINKAKSISLNTFKGKKYRITILSDVLIRFEYSETGTFNDYPTFFASNRSFGKPKYTVEEDNQILIIKNDKFILQYYKEKPFIGSRLSPDQNLKVTITGSEKTWYYNHPEVRNFMGIAYSLDDTRGNAKYEKGLFSLDGFTAIDDSKTPIISIYGNVIAPNYNNIDTYLFIYNNDFGEGLRDYFNLTGMPIMPPRYAFGVWWNKDESYTEMDIQTLVNNFRKNEIPISVLLLGNYARTKNMNSNISFSLDKNIFPNTLGLSEYLKKNNIKLGVTIKTEGVLSNEEVNFNEFSKIYEKNESVVLNPYDAKMMNAFLKGIINPFITSGVDFFLNDDNNIKNRTRNFTMNYYLYNTFSNFTGKRNFLLSRNNGIAPHRYSALYSGHTVVSWKTLKLLPFFNATAANIGISYWSHDIGGYKDGIEDSELYMRFVQFGVFSPILRLSSRNGKYYKREPWRWDAKTNKIVKDYLRLRHRLIPYLYSEANKYSKFGSPIVQPLYYKYPETYDEPLYKNEYYFGSELFVCPIVDSKDNVMNRVVHKIFLPNGIWYDFRTGKKFIGGKRYVTFYKDEDYPVFAKTGAIIPLAKMDNNINDTSSPKKLEIQIFPGRSNTYKLYEDDGVSDMYKQGNSLTTEINYYYKENDFSVSISPLEGKQGVIPEKRSYIIRFRNTKFTNGVQVFANEINVPFRRYTDDTDFVIEFDNIDTSSKIFVYCKGKDIEIDAGRVINEDLESIINDLQIETYLKEEIDNILFSDKDIKSKRIAIRRLKGLPTIFVKMFLKLLEYVAEL